MTTRRLAAIMFTDIVGYTALMGADEEHAFKMLRKNRDIHRHLIKKYNGELIKEMGDGMLASFSLATDAVRCAKAIQIEAGKQNIPLKIGIHEGEMVFEGSDVLGDGVNIASRLQESAGEGCIAISEPVYRDVRNKVDIEAEFAGERSFKNVDEPVKVYHVSCEVLPVKENAPDSTENIRKHRRSIFSQSRKKIAIAFIIVLTGVALIVVYIKIPRKDKFENIRDTGGRISVAVMPFRNLTGDSLYNVWQSGFQNLLITTLSNSKDLAVRQYQLMYTLFQNKKNVNYASFSPAQAGELARKLDTRTFILGNILKAGKRIRVTAQLVNSETKEIYKTFNVSGKADDDIFNMADSLSSLIKNYLEIRQMIEKNKMKYLSEGITTESSEAFLYYIRGYNAFMDGDYRSTIDWASKALQIDSNFVSAYIGLAFAYTMSGDDDMARKVCEIAYDKRDRLPLRLKLRAEYLHAYYFKTPEEEIQYLKQLLEMDKLNMLLWHFLGDAYYSEDKFTDAIRCFSEAIRLHKKFEVASRNPWTYDLLARSYHQTNEHKKENEIYDTGLKLFPDYGNLWYDKAICALTRGDTATANDCIAHYTAIRKDRQKWSEANILSRIGNIYSKAGLPEKAEAYYRRAFEMDPRDPIVINNLAWFLTDQGINVPEGLRLARKALEIEPDNPYVLDTKGWGLYKLGRYEEALKVLKQAWDLRPYYDHKMFMHIKEVKKAFAAQNKKEKEKVRISRYNTGLPSGQC